MQSTFRISNNNITFYLRYCADIPAGRTKIKNTPCGCFLFFWKESNRARLRKDFRKTFRKDLRKKQIRLSLVFRIKGVISKEMLESTCS